MRTATHRARRVRAVRDRRARLAAACRGFTRDAVPDDRRADRRVPRPHRAPCVAPAVGGAVVLGYLVDLISGTPPGLSALVLGADVPASRARVQQRILVRGAAMTIGVLGVRRAGRRRCSR